MSVVEALFWVGVYFIFEYMAWPLRVLGCEFAVAAPDEKALMESLQINYGAYFTTTWASNGRMTFIGGVWSEESIAAKTRFD